MGETMESGLKMLFRCLVFGLGITACAGAPAPETPPPVAPTKRERQRQPLPPAPSNTPEVVYARQVSTPTPEEPRLVTEW